MFKGCKREAIVLKDTGSDLFEEAHFLLRDGAARPGEEDLVAEAEQVIARARIGRMAQSAKHRDALRQALWFVIGLLTGMGLMLLF